VHKNFDRRVVPDDILEFVRACQSVVPCHLAGGAALAGAWLRHRLSRDIDLFVHDAQAHRDLVRNLDEIAGRTRTSVQIVRDAGGHVRARLETRSGQLELDLVHESLPDLEEPTTVESVVVESFRDLRASKLTCILSRSEPRDLVDLMFLERAGYPPERDIADALRKDAGIDPGILAWLLKNFPVEPLPRMIETITVEELRAYRDALAERLKILSRPTE
jgi:hypothetical protein